MIKINDKEILFDEIDYDLKIYKWYIDIKGHGYAYTEDIEMDKRTYMHRLIMQRVLGRKLDIEEEVDHKNRISLDNRRLNLRVLDHHSNCLNRSRIKKVNSSSKYRGVRYKKSMNSWEARLMIYGITFGDYFNTEIEAAEHYNMLARRWHGPFAFQNEII